jgi:hypothetical protein
MAVVFSEVDEWPSAAAAWWVTDHRRDDTETQRQHDGITAECACPGKSGCVGALRLGAPTQSTGPATPATGHFATS